MLVPGQPALLLGAMLTALGLVAVLAPVLLPVAHLGVQGGDGPPSGSPAPRAARGPSTSPFVIGGVLIFAGARSGLYWIAAGDILSIVAIVMSAWVLMIEITALTPISGRPVGSLALLTRGIW